MVRGTHPTLAEEFNSGTDEQQQRRFRAVLRNNTLHKVAKCGEIFVKNALNEMLTDYQKYPQMKPYCDDLCHALEQWKHAHAEHSWTPLKSDELWEVLEKNAHLVQTHKDLFDLVCEIITDVKNEISRGEANLKALLWDKKDKNETKENGKNETKENWKPAIEKKLQIITANEIKKHPILQNQHIVVGRELEVGGNHSDIFITGIFPNGERAKVHIEIKCQQYYEKPDDNLLTAIREQLAKKYLGDSEARYGIYLVGWYGTQFKGINKKLEKECGEIPKTAQELEKCLQSLCDKVADSRRADIDGMKAIVIDVSQRA
jgi:hypothetical protein